MATKVLDSLVASSTGIKSPALAKFPEFGATFQATLTAGNAVVQLRAWPDNANAPNSKEILVTFTLPVPAGPPKAGDMFDSLPAFAVWDKFDWNVVSLSGGNLTLSCVGVGV